MTGTHPIALPVLVVRKKDLPIVLGLGQSTVDDMRRNGKFPKPRLIGAGRAVGWPVDELKAWLLSLPQVDTEVEGDAES